MRKLRLAFFCAGTNFRKWAHNPSFYALALLWTCITVNEFKGITQFCIDNGYRISPWLLPFYIDDHYQIFIFIATLTILFAQAPFCDTSAPFTMIRTGKQAWFFGQFLYIIAASAIYIGFTYGIILLTVSPVLGVSMDWGGVMQGFSENDAFLREYNCNIDFSGSLMRAYTPMQATIYVFLLLWLVAVLVGTILLCFNTVLKPLAGIAIVGAIEGWSWSCVRFMLLYGAWMLKTNLFHWCTPLTLYPLQSDGMEMHTAAIIQLLLIVLLVTVGTVVFCRKDTQFEKSMF